MERLIIGCIAEEEIFLLDYIDPWMSFDFISNKS
ncbi:hypothetical protein BCD96_004663 [Clostridium beijerinckii]|nr:hypothetical protein [Clostridium beijerinckii]NOW06301.1 hypothetical protein [Clostridium beijerinckii]NRT37293.1 hypothetical protein [Clostridium beijerinckii]NRT43273.1 hypothetical protein [Clostridium beijerinckii]NRU36951.1 hypothetical protein [Clostridium beijerinckii]